jgi:hypothetical protein
MRPEVPDFLSPALKIVKQAFRITRAASFFELGFEQAFFCHAKPRGKSRHTLIRIASDEKENEGRFTARLFLAEDAADRVHFDVVGFFFEFGFVAEAVVEEVGLPFDRIAGEMSCRFGKSQMLGSR